jgi:phenylacetate-coenzyme A ligase PaaK-like adenylate-forming protein
LRSSLILDRALSQIDVYKSWQPLDPGPEFHIDCRFAAMPALTKKDLREYFPLGLLPHNLDINHGIASGEIQMVETSGTTDDKVTNIWNQQWWDSSERASWKLNSKIDSIATGKHKEAILVNPRNVGIISDTVDLPMEQRSLSRFLYLNEKTDTLAWSPALMDRMIEELAVYQPAVLEANPSYLARLCRYISRRGKTVFQPGVIVFTYECPMLRHYDQIERVFTAPLVSSYGTTETGYVFMQCEEGSFHQNSEFCRVDFQPFKSEQSAPLTGRILVTPFNNPWNYFLRFDTGDLVTVKENCVCNCGRNGGLILKSINGRRVNLTLTCEGKLITLYDLDNALAVLKGVDEFQLVQKDKTTYELHLVSPREDKACLTEEAGEVLSNLYGEEAQVKVIFNRDIAPEQSGKYLYAKAQFQIDLESYLNKDCYPNDESHRS